MVIGLPNADGNCFREGREAG